MISIDLIKVPLNHFFSDFDVKRLEGVFHESPKLSNIDQFILISFFISGVDSSTSKEMTKLHNKKFTYSSKVIFPSLF